MTRKLFGTDGIRGRANIYPMTGEVAFLLGRAVTAYFQGNDPTRQPVIIIGKDTRLSCYMLEQAFSAGVCSQGGKAILTGPLPTPGVAFVTQSMRADAGVMISASHNSFEDNGIKIFNRYGNKLPDSVELQLEELILNPTQIPVQLDGQLGSAKRLDEVVGRYIVKVKQALSEEYSLEGMRLVVDGANGAAYRVAPLAFEELGAEVISIGNKPNGRNINEDVGALHPETCAEMVVKYRADLGICLDGDADRIVLVTKNGKIINGDQLIGVLAKLQIEKNGLGVANEVVGTVMSNLGLEKYIQGLGAKFYRAKVGDRYILERMLKTGSVFGGEPSGHIIFKDYSTTGDGILAALKAIEAVKYFKKDLDELVSEIKLMPQLLVNVKVKKKVPFEKNDVISSELKKQQKILADNGRILLRYSGTEKLARVMVEGANSSEVDKCCHELAEVIKKELA